MRKPPTPHCRSIRPGSALAEFALISLVLTLLLAGIIELGRALNGAQVEQQAADVGARELSRTPLPATGITLQNLLDGNVDTNDPNQAAALAAVRKIYDPDWLAFDLSLLGPNQAVGDYYAANGAPLLNQQLLTLMIFDPVQANAGTRMLRFPCAVSFTADSSRPSGFHVTSATVVAVTYDPTTGAETIDTAHPIPIVQEITFGMDNHSAFGLDSPEGGLIALRINYPFQAATLSNYAHDPTASDPLAPNGTK